jgi:predicted transcriptional regulator
MTNNRSAVMEVEMDSAGIKSIDLSAPVKNYIRRHVAVLYADQSAVEAIESIREQDVRKRLFIFMWWT